MSDPNPSTGPDRGHTPGGGFLGSPGNLTGLAALVVVFLAVFLPSQSLAAALIAGLLAYGAGYFLAPAGRADPAVEIYASGVPVTGATQRQMRDRLGQLSSRLQAEARRIPPGVRDDLARALGQLREIVERWDTVAAAPEQRLVIESVVYVYLPTSLDVFLRIPDADKPHHAGEWADQIGTLCGEIERSRDRVMRRDVEALRTQGRLLEQRFQDGDLQAFREHGL